jgi:hypothetical protein
MAPQEFIVNLARKSPPIHFLLSLLGWFAMLSILYVLFRGLARIVKGEGAYFALSVPLCCLVALLVEWLIIGNSPWANPKANQVGLFAGWISVFLLPRAFLDARYKIVQFFSVVWYAVFILSLLVPLALSRGNGPLVAVTVYGYTVIPFLILTLASGIQATLLRKNQAPDLR